MSNLKKYKVLEKKHAAWLRKFLNPSKMAMPDSDGSIYKPAKERARKLEALENFKPWKGSTVSWFSHPSGDLIKIITHPGGAVARINLTKTSRTLRG